jgi:hypothetical protein
MDITRKFNSNTQQQTETTAWKYLLSTVINTCFFVKHATVGAEGEGTIGSGKNLLSLFLLIKYFKLNIYTD